MRARFYINTFGCRCNQADSAAIRGKLYSMELEETDRSSDADFVVVNTCTITHRTDQQVRQTIRRILRENPAAKLIATGCYAQRDPNALAAISGVDLVVGNSEKDNLWEHLDRQASGEVCKVIHSPLSSCRGDLPISTSPPGSKTRPLIKLQDGCDCSCSYCIVPSVRGHGRSSRPEDVLAAIGNQVERGFKEIILTGVHLGAYGAGKEEAGNLADLLRLIARIPGLGRIRLSSVEPMQFDRSIVRLVAQNPVFARHFHIPIQSGSDRILGRMRRPYTASRLLDLLHYVEHHLPAAALGTDIMVGFPGETEEDFQSTYEFIKGSPLTYLHVFPFSSRPNTEAHEMPDKVPPGVIRDRAALLRGLSQNKNLEFRRRFLRRHLPAISLSREEGLGESIVLTDNYIHARVAGNRVPANRLLEVRILDAQPEYTSAAIR